MKKLVRVILVNAFSLFFTALIFPGLVLKGGFQTLFFGGLFLAIGNALLSPIIGIITLPFNILTLGLFSFVTTLISLLFITYFYHAIQIRQFYFQGISLDGVEIKAFMLSQVLSYIVISATIYLIVKAMNWLFSK